MAGGYREGAGRKKKPDDKKYHLKTFCIDKDVLDWINNDHPKKNGHALVRKLLRQQFKKESANG